MLGSAGPTSYLLAQGSAPVPMGTLRTGKGDGQPLRSKAQRQLLWFFPFCFHGFCMFHILRAERMERGREKLRSCEERPSYPPTRGESILRRQPLRENKAAQTLALSVT